jgi:hypothetical protein
LKLKEERTKYQNQNSIKLGKDQKYKEIRTGERTGSVKPKIMLVKKTLTPP